MPYWAYNARKQTGKEKRMPIPYSTSKGCAADGAEIAQPSHVLLRRARKARGMSLQQVADACGMNIRQYQKFESGERDVAGCAFVTGLKLCRVLDLNPWLFLNVVPVRANSSTTQSLAADASAKPARYVRTHADIPAQPVTASHSEWFDWNSQNAKR